MLPPRVLVLPALAAASLASSLLALAALTGAAVRVLPWLLEPTVPLATAAPFARSLAAIAAEAAILTGFPMGVAHAFHRFTEREETRALMLLGTRPAAIVARVLPVALGFSAIVAVASLVAGDDAREPGRVLDELVHRGRAACLRPDRPTVSTIPFADAAWLCEPRRPPRFAVRGPGSLSGVLVTASGAHFSGDLRRMRLVDARLLLGPADVRVGELSLHGLPPWASASVLPAWLRAIAMGSAGLAGACVAAWGVIRLRTSRPSTRTVAVLLGASGPVAALALLRLLERTAPEVAHAGDLASFLLIPVVAGLAPWILLRVFWILPKLKRAATPTG